MKLQPASKKEVSRIAVGCILCAVLMLLCLFILSLLGIGHFSYRMILGAIGGTAVAVFNFTLMCIMVQNAAGIQDQKYLKAKVQASYNLRLFIQAVWVIVAFLVPQINLISAAIPLVFPTVVIYYLQVTGKLMPKTASSSAPVSRLDEEEPDDTEEDLGPFEV